MKNILFLLTIILIFSSSFKNLKEYKIIGVATGFSDSTVLYLDNITDGSFRHIDSTFIINEKFTFKGVLKERIVKTSIRTKDFKNRCYVWLENTTINFNGEKGKFKDAIIKGSKSQDDQYRLNALTNNAKDTEEIEYQFAKNNLNTIISANVVSVYCSTWDKDKVKKLYNSFSDELKNTYYGKNILDFLTFNKNIKIGDIYSDFSQNDINQKKVNLSDFKGKVILVEFWGSWCGPCREGNPELVTIYSDFKNKGFEILGVAAETDKTQWLNAIKKDNLTWTNVTDFKGNKNKAAIIYGVSYYPTNFLIDRTGTIIARDLTGEKLREKLKEVFN